MHVRREHLDTRLGPRCHRGSRLHVNFDEIFTGSPAVAGRSAERDLARLTDYMAHNERRASPAREGAIGLVTGAVYGITHTLSGHPLDNIKARLQMDKSFFGLSAVRAAKQMWTREGIQSFFRGALHPLWG